jgi:hypothetical protein
METRGWRHRASGYIPHRTHRTHPPWTTPPPLLLPLLPFFPPPFFFLRCQCEGHANSKRKRKKGTYFFLCRVVSCHVALLLAVALARPSNNSEFCDLRSDDLVLVILSIIRRKSNVCFFEIVLSPFRFDFVRSWQGVAGFYCWHRPRRRRILRSNWGLICSKLIVCMCAPRACDPLHPEA